MAVGWVRVWGPQIFFVCEELFFWKGVFRVKFAMESDALVVLGQRSQTESEWSATRFVDSDEKQV